MIRPHARPEAGACAAPRSGLTLVELVLALGLFALVTVGLVQLIDTTLAVWEEAELEREDLEREAALARWLERDLEYLVGGGPGDLLCDWELFDVDGDGIATRPAPRLRLVRRATAEELMRLGRRTTADASGETARPPGNARPLVEVLWALELPTAAPERPVRGDGVLVRVERLLDAPGSLFDPTAIGPGGRVAAVGAEPLAVGVLHWEVLFASQTTSLAGGWRAGTELASAGRAWDARGAGRPDVDRHPFNRIAPGSPAYRGAPLLPRRIRVEFELERPADTARRPALSQALGPQDVVLVLDRSRDLPPVGRHLLLGEEWVRVTAAAGGRLSVTRGQRGTRPAAHAAGTPVQWGETVVREVVVPQHVEDWDL